MLQAKRISQVTFLQSEALQGIPGIVHGFSTRRPEDSEFTLGQHPSNWEQFAWAVGASGWPIVQLKQIHSNVVTDIVEPPASTEIIEGDASVTSLNRVLLGIQTADCVPVLIAASRGEAVAAIHAGWRGTAARISTSVVRRLAGRLRVEPGSLTAVIGPHIGVCCYEVGDDVVRAVNDPRVFKGMHLDLGEANRLQLIAGGMSPDRILTSSLCTKCRSDLFFSYRRDGERTGRMLAVIGIAQ